MEKNLLEAAQVVAVLLKQVELNQKQLTTVVLQAACLGGHDLDDVMDTLVGDAQVDQLCYRKCHKVNNQNNEQ